MPRLRALRRTAALPALLLLTLAAAGCVERILRIESEPPGASVILDGEPAGTTPVDIPFTWYGTREIILEKPGHESVRAMEKVPAPWWQWFPIDVVADVLLPIPIRDVHEFRYELKPHGSDTKTFEETRKRADEFRKKAGDGE